MDIVMIPIKDIKDYENNPRKNDKAVEYVARSINDFGFKQPIIIDKDNVIVCGHFSDADLISTSMQRNSKGIVASTNKVNYVFKKGTHFKANDFIKAVKTAQMRGTSYDDAVHKWLTKNAKKYGYKYYKTT